MTSAAASTASKPSKFQVPRHPEEMTVRQAKPLLHRSTGISSYVDHLTGDNRFESVTRESSLGKFNSLGGRNREIHNGLRKSAVLLDVSSKRFHRSDFHPCEHFNNMACLREIAYCL